ncbi:MAG: hypothetical protein IT457_10300 [Planctomycetes bacterium]|nr:hypothetical protein [Planctomycetota bacterium]
MGKFVATLFSSAVLCALAPAQTDYFEQTLDSQRVRFDVFQKLSPVPIQIGSEGGNLIAKFEPADEGDYIHGRNGTFSWQLYVYEFEGNNAPSEGPSTGDKPKTGDDEVSPEDLAKRAMEEFRRSAKAKTFADFVAGKDPTSSGEKRKVLVKGKANKGGGKKPPSTWWEYVDVKAMVNYSGQFDQLWYTTTACYTLPEGKEIALSVVLPVKSGEKPDAKWNPIVKRMLTSLQYLGPAEDDGGAAEPKDKYADTEEEKEALERLKKNIGDLKNWDYFTTEDFIVTFAWKLGDGAHQKEMIRFARWTAKKLEDARAMFKDRYPPHPGMKRNYSIIRICYDYGEFQKYGDTPTGVVGWFSPGTKELVIYHDAQRIFCSSEEEMLSIAYHEAWHQYSDQYWPEVELHRWFDEGLAEYFGSLRRSGKNEVLVPHKGRLDSLREQMASKTLIPSGEIVGWSRAKFYGARAPDHYAQAWAMADFLIRGKAKLGAKWDPEWSEILPTYAKIALEEKDAEKAARVCLEGVDAIAWEAAWIDWVKSGAIKRK